MKQNGGPSDRLCQPRSRRPRPRHLGGWRCEAWGSSPPNGRISTRVEIQARACSRRSTSQQRAGYSTPIPQGYQFQIHYNSSLSFNTLREPPVLSFLTPIRVVHFHQLGPWWHTYASPQFHHCVAGPDHASIRARIRQALASLHKLRAPGNRRRQPFVTTRSTNHSQSQVADPPGKRSRFKTNEDGREASSPHRPRCG